MEETLGAAKGERTGREGGKLGPFFRTKQSQKAKEFKRSDHGNCPKGVGPKMV